MQTTWHSSLIRTGWLLCAAAWLAPAAFAAAPPAAKKAAARVGQIIIVGNEITRQDVILREVPLYPGQVLSLPELRAAERKLRRLGLFECKPDGSVKPTVKVLDNPADPDSPFKDVLISVQEANTGSMMFGLGVNSKGGLAGSIVLQERNFDLFRFPTSLDDLTSGRAFRGAGMTFRLELIPSDLTVRVRIDPEPVQHPVLLALCTVTRWLGCLPLP